MEIEIERLKDEHLNLRHNYNFAALDNENVKLEQQMNQLQSEVNELRRQNEMLRDVIPFNKFYSIN